MHRSLTLALALLLPIRSFATDCPKPGAPLSASQISTIASSQASLLKQACRQQRDFLKSAFASRSKPADVIAAAANAKTPVVIVGESHAERATQFYKEMIQNLREKNPQLDCIAVEQPAKTYQAALDACNANFDCDRKGLPVFSGVNQGLDLHMKVFAVDAESKMRQAIFSFGGGDDGEPPNFLDDVQNRNHEMANRTAALIDGQRCHGAILIVGRNHALTKPGLASVTELLNQKKIASYRIMLASPGKNASGSIEDLWTWTDQAGKKSACGEMPGAVGENFGFTNLAKGQGVPAEYTAFSDPFKGSKELLGTWADYDGAIFLGCADSQTQKCEPDGGVKMGLKAPTYLK